MPPATARSRSSLLFLPALLLAPLILGACGDDEGSGPPEITTVVVSPGSRTLTQVGQTAQFTAQPINSEGDEPSGFEVTWSTSDATVATVDGQGLATATGPGSVQVLAEVAGVVGSATLTVQACPTGDLVLAVGQSAVFPPSCSFTLPAGQDGDRYRIGVVRTEVTDASSDVVSMTLRLSANSTTTAPLGGSAREEASPVVEEHYTGPRFRLPEAIETDLQRARATSALHARLHGSVLTALLSRIGPGGVLSSIERRGEAEEDRTTAAARTPSPERRVFRLPSSTSDPEQVCEVREERPAFLVGENDFMAIYQDSVQSRTFPADPATVQLALDYYRDHGKEVIDAYFGGVSDIDGNERLLVYISPEATGNTAAFVFGVNFLDPGQCASSNGGELIFLNQGLVQSAASGDSYQLLPTLVHEAKHVSSVYKRIQGGRQQPVWIEEGSAEIAGEMSGRLAWSEAGGPAVGHPVGAEDFQNGFTPENWGVVLRLARTIWFLSSQPNSVLLDPDGADAQHTFYGSSWHFHRFLGDAYGQATGGFASGAGFFFDQTDPGETLAGTEGLRSLTGKPFEELLVEFTRAILFAGTGVAPPQRAFKTYDFVQVTEVFSSPDPIGRYPWSVHHTLLGTELAAAPFVTRNYTGRIGPAGIRVHDFASDGTASADISVDFPGDEASVVVVRLR